ncbi:MULTISPECIES: hypothetical protein [unclassified Arthrobacter]|uniref:hypothetical protein n=1 Tax=unclassified Arthrobacter TaxID=235627 RepID=UPI001D14AEE3|nr:MULTISPECIES: hypothetical protein [unclassified Arthrobacter]MCC3274259.1 hypothetical protein [Arthrobacter sp. zg-Y20]MCC9178148.1 hypothetical protein [Arthrobacter sp. zg-Y750]MDK1314415.1 hypothetical protein [Arthrobacter sp. zg.Y20]MDK1327302.1 hypothetical protein [Arthrobacter sp. zg-Y1143]WIB07406.1 hypothetical protein QNO06_06765 [Arthrobacter sp. zg-Y20]
MPDSHPAWPDSPAATGDPAVDALLEGLSALAGEPVSGQAAAYAALHDGLLAELNTEPDVAAASGAPMPGGPRAGR